MDLYIELEFIATSSKYTYLHTHKAYLKMFREEDTLLAGAKNGNAPTIVSSKLIVSFFVAFCSH